MAGIKRTVAEILGLASLALLPFGVFAYLYSHQLLVDIGNLPSGVVEGLLLYPGDTDGLRSTLRWMRTYSIIFLVVSVVLLSVYLSSYVRKPEAYIDAYQGRLSVFGAVAALVWIGVIVWWGYIPARSTVAQYSVIAEHNPQPVEGILYRGTSEYEIAVFDRAAAGAAIALGIVWWIISVVSLLMSSAEDSESSVWDGTASYLAKRRQTNARKGETGEEKAGFSYCPSCGHDLPGKNVRSGYCPDCGKEFG